MAFALVMLSAIPLTRAGINTWSALGPEGGRITKVEFHKQSAGLVYAQAASGFHRSLDGGAHWSQNNDGIAEFATDFAVDPVDSNRVYLVGRPGRIWLSTDAGATFSVLHTFDTSDTVPRAVAASNDGNTLWTLYNQDTFRSTDRGQTWQKRAPLPISVALNRVLADRTDTLYVAHIAGLWVTRDGGTSWSSPLQTPVRDLVINPTFPVELWAATSSGLQRSTDAGASWSVTFQRSISAITLDPRMLPLMYVADSQGRVLYGDGLGWIDIVPQPLLFPFPNHLAANPHAGQPLMLANNLGLYAVTDGLNWSRTDSGLIASRVAGFAHSTASGRTYMSGNQLHILNDGSDSITLLINSELFNAVGVRSTFIDSVVPTGEPGVLIAGVGGRIGRSTDDGSTWRNTGYNVEPPDRVVSLAVSPLQPSVYYASSDLTVHKSTDQGATWTEIRTGLPQDYSPGLLAIAPDNPALLYAGARKSEFGLLTGAGVYKTSNAGMSWVAANVGLESSIVNALAIHPTQSETVYAATTTGLYKTLDGGTSWAKLNWSSGAVETAAVAIDPHRPTTVYAAGRPIPGDVARSLDGGVTWESLVSPGAPLSWVATSLMVDPARQDTLRASTATAGVRQISIRPDLSIESGQMPAHIPLGAFAPFSFTVRNLGPFTASGVTAVIRLPTIIADASTKSGRCTVAAATIVCTAPSLRAGGTMQISAAAQPLRSGAFDIVSSVRADQGDPVAANNSITLSSTATELTDLSVSIDGPTTAAAGRGSLYAVAVINAGPSPSSGLRATYQVPAGMTIDDVSAQFGVCSRPSTDTAVCDVSSLEAGKAAVLSIRATAAAAGTYRMNATVSGQGSDDSNANNTDSFSITVNAAPAPGGGGGGGGGSLSLVSLLGLALLLWRRQGLIGGIRERVSRTARAMGTKQELAVAASVTSRFMTIQLKCWEPLGLDALTSQKV